MDRNGFSCPDFGVLRDNKEQLEEKCASLDFMIEKLEKQSGESNKQTILDTMVRDRLKEDLEALRYRKTALLLKIERIAGRMRSCCDLGEHDVKALEPLRKRKKRG